MGRPPGRRRAAGRRARNWESEYESRACPSVDATDRRGPRASAGHRPACRRPVRRLVRSRHRRDAGRPGPGGLAPLASHPERLGVQPPRPDRSGERGGPHPGLVARAGGGEPAGDAARLRRGHVLPESEQRHPGDRRCDGRSPVGVQAADPRRHRDLRGRPGDGEPQSGDLRGADHRHGERRLRLRPRRGDRRTGLGDPDRRLRGGAGEALDRADRCRGSCDLRA